MANYQLHTRPAQETDRRFAYEVKRAALGAYVAQVWGWDEEFQQEFHARDWQVRRPDIIVLDGQDVGTLEYVRHDDHYHVGRFYLLPEHQRRGLGSELLQRMLSLAKAEGLPVRLQILKVNPARSLYERYGFQVCGETETHFQMVRDPQASTSRPRLSSACRGQAAGHLLMLQVRRGCLPLKVVRWAHRRSNGRY